MSNNQPNNEPMQEPINYNIEESPVENEMKRSYLEYAMSVIVGRALPDIRDGLKPVHRRIMYAMHTDHNYYNRAYVKSASIVGTTMKDFHPHGDSSIYDACARMAQNFQMRIPLVDGQGNWGSLDGDSPAAMRYCVVGDTLVKTPNGTFSMQDLAEGMKTNSEKPVSIIVYDKDGKGVHASKVFHSGKHQTLQITTKEGFSLSGTTNHPVLCVVNLLGVPMFIWKLMEEIEEGDKVVILRNQPKIDQEISDYDKDLALLLGAFVSKGLCSKKASFCHTDKEYFYQVVEAYSNVVGSSAYVTQRFLKTGEIIHEFEVHDLETLYNSPLGMVGNFQSADKDIPAFVWQQNMRFKQIFLQSLFTGGGVCSPMSTPTCQISYASLSPKLIKHIQEMLLEFGVVGQSCSLRSGENQVSLNNLREKALFFKNVGFYGSKNMDMQNALLQGKTNQEDLDKDYIPFVSTYIRENSGVNESSQAWFENNNIDQVANWEGNQTAILQRIANPETRKVVEPLFNSDYYYATVCNVKSTGAQNVYSLKVDTKDHSFVTNGFVSHNTEARMTKAASALLQDLDKETVEWQDNYDGRVQEPQVLTARFPNLLVNGSSGIAVGMATNIPPHNLKEVVEAICLLIEKPEVDVTELMQHIKAPDFPTGGYIVGRSGIKQAYETGRGRVIMRGVTHIEEIRNHEAIIITELPYGVQKGDGRNEGKGIIKNIVSLMVNKKITDIADIRDESDRDGMRIVVELKTGAMPQVVLNQLYKHSPLQTSFGINMVALDHGRPRTFNLKQALEAYVNHQVDVVTRRTRFDLNKARKRAHILEGLLIALNNLDLVIKIIRGSKSQEIAKAELISQLGLSDIQAQSILDMRLGKLTATEVEEVQEEHDRIKKFILDMRTLLGSEKNILAVVKKELVEISEDFFEPRKSQIIAAENDLEMEDLIPEETTLVLLTEGGYLKRMSTSEFRTQSRGGVGSKGIELKDKEDALKLSHVSSTHDWLMLFTNQGRMWRMKAWQIPEGSRTAKGRALANLFDLEKGEEIIAITSLREFLPENSFVFGTKQGMVKRSSLEAYNSSFRNTALKSLALWPGDELVSVQVATPEDSVLMLSQEGMMVRFDVDKLRSSGRTSGGVKGITLAQNDSLASLSIATDQDHMLVISSDGYGKRTPVELFRKTSRGGKGVQALKKGSRESLVGALKVSEGDDLLLLSQRGMVQRLSCDNIPVYSRTAQGVTVMKLKGDDTVGLISLIDKESIEAEITEAPIVVEEENLNVLEEVIQISPEETEGIIQEAEDILDTEE